MKGTLLPTLTVCAALTGCAAQIKYVPVMPPSYLMEDCPPAQYRDVTTNGRLARSLQEAEFALDLCNNTKEALRVWAGQGTQE